MNKNTDNSNIQQTADAVNILRNAILQSQARAVKAVMLTFSVTFSVTFSEIFSETFFETAFPSLPRRLWAFAAGAASSITAAAIVNILFIITIFGFCTVTTEIAPVQLFLDELYAAVLGTALIGAVIGDRCA